MENASKALLIAGSVLIVILLIAVGVRVFNSTQGTTDSVETTMNATEIAMFNNKFLQHVGANKSKAQAVSLLNQVIANNSSTSNHRVYVTLQKDGTTNGAAHMVSDINNIINGENGQSLPNQNAFTIEVGYGNAGYVNLVKIY